MFLVMHLHRKFWFKTITYVSLLLVVMQLMPTIAIFTGAYSSKDGENIKDYSLSDQGFSTYSKKDNVFVFCLDTLDTQFVEKIMKQTPTFFNKMDGFTLYTNATSLYSRTKPAVCNLLTGGDELAYKVPTEDYYKKAWTNGGKNILKVFKDAGYSVEMYATAPFLFEDVDYAKKYVSNFTSSKGDIRFANTFMKMMELSSYRYGPIAFKPFFYSDTNYYNDVFEESDVSVYRLDDAKYLSEYSKGSTDESDKKFKFYHFYGSHPPFSLNEDGSKSTSPTTLDAQTRGCFNKLFEAFDKMKELGIYENATIIVTADHGDPIDVAIPLQRETRAAIFYKPSGKAGTEIKCSKAQVSTNNVPATLVKATGQDYSLYGKALDDIGENEQITRYFYKVITDKSYSNEIELHKYEIKGDASNFKNWKLIEKTGVVDNFFK